MQANIKSETLQRKQFERGMPEPGPHLNVESAVETRGDPH